MTLSKSLEKLLDKFIELHGDRIHGETEQVKCGLGWIGKQRVVIILHNHRTSLLLGGAGGGNDLSIGYRKSLRMLRLAEQLRKPVLWCVENVEVDLSNLSLNLLNNINENIKTILKLKVPIIGVLSFSASKSTMINPNILDYTILLTDNDAALETSEEGAEVISLENLSLLKTCLIDKLS